MTDFTIITNKELSSINRILALAEMAGRVEIDTPPLDGDEDIVVYATKQQMLNKIRELQTDLANSDRIGNEWREAHHAMYERTIRAEAEILKIKQAAATIRAALPLLERGDK